MTYRQRKFMTNLITIIAIIIFVIVVVAISLGMRASNKISESENLEIAEKAVRQSVMSCYAVDGVYPSSYEDLKSKCNIAINDNEYKVFYDIFASNIMPDISVIKINNTSGE